MNVLALETSSAAGSVALVSAGRLRERWIAAPREQTAVLLPLIRELCEAARIGLGDLDLIAFGRGPGSFTGLRVAAAITQGFALAHDTPVVGVSSLAAIAQRAWREHGIARALVVVDARMGEVYSAEHALEDGLARLRGAEQIGRPEAVARPEGPGWAALGDAFERYAAELEHVAAGASRVLAGLGPAARDLVPLAEAELAAGRTLAPEAALPVYLREASAWRRDPRGA